MLSLAQHWLGPLLAAPFVGSFLGVLVARMPAGRSVVFGRSACPHCGTQLAPRDLLPLLSWLVSRGRCRHCGASLSIFYPAIEAGACGVAAWAALTVPGSVLWATCALGWILLALASMDARTFILADALTLPLLAGGLAVTALLSPSALAEHALAAAAGFCAFAAVAWAYRHLRAREGLGQGDSKLLAGAGAWIGLGGLPSVVLIAATAALAMLLLHAKADAALTADTRVPFGSYLALGLWLTWLYGPIAVG